MSLRIAIDLRPLQSSSAKRGIGRWLSEFTRALGQIDTHSHYILLWEGFQSVPDIFTHQSVLRLPQKIPGIRWAMDYVLNPIFVKLAKADVYFTADNMAYPYNRSDTLVISVVHDFLPLTLPDYKWRTRLGCHLNFDNLATHDHVFMVSDFTLNEAAHFLSAPLPSMSKLGVGVNTERFYQASDAQIAKAKLAHQVERYFIYVGESNPRKNLARLVQAIDELPQDIPLLLVGTSHAQSRELQEALSHLKNPSRVKLLGYVPDDDLVGLMSGAVAMVFPSLAEGFGLPVLEAMACGTPVITSNSSSLPEAAGDAAILINPTSVHAISEAMQQVLTQENLRASMTAKGLVQAQQFRWSHCAELFLERCQILMHERLHRTVI